VFSVSPCLLYLVSEHPCEWFLLSNTDTSSPTAVSLLGNKAITMRSKGINIHKIIIRVYGMIILKWMLREIGCKDVDWIQLAQYKFHSL